MTFLDAPKYELEGWFDGANTPDGHGAYGALIRRAGAVVWREAKYIGHSTQMSNNVAEYSGVIAVLRRVRDMQATALIHGDSMLVIKHLRGEWKRNEGLYMPYYEEAKALVDEMPGMVAFMWVPREQNVDCDALSKEALRRRANPSTQWICDCGMVFLVPTPHNCRLKGPMHDPNN